MKKSRKPDRFERVARNAAHSIQPVDLGSSEGIAVFAETLRREHKWMMRMVNNIYGKCREVAKDDGVQTEHHRGWDSGIRFVVSDIINQLAKRRK